MMITHNSSQQCCLDENEIERQYKNKVNEKQSMRLLSGTPKWLPSVVKSRNENSKFEADSLLDKLNFNSSSSKFALVSTKKLPSLFVD